jgi:hypothetical protein
MKSIIILGLFAIIACAVAIDYPTDKVDHYVDEDLALRNADTKTGTYDLNGKAWCTLGKCVDLCLAWGFRNFQAWCQNANTCVCRGN